MTPARLRVLYLHGFASTPESRKAGFFARKLRDLGFKVDIPDLAEGNFERLTITGQLSVIERAVNNQPVILIGSSLGGYLAALYASARPEVDRLILLAPAFQFHKLWTDELGPERLALWREKGVLSVFHYGQNREVPIRYQLMQDAIGYAPFPDFHQDALIFHGAQDTVVPIEYSRIFVQQHENARLISVQSGHELTDVLDQMWPEIARFVGADSDRIGC